MFDPATHPRIFGCAPGVDFSRALVLGITERMADKPPEELARVEVFVNTRRMQRRILDLFDQGPARLLPRIRLITDLADDIGVIDIPPAVSPLRRRLELRQLISKLLDQEPGLAPRSALFDLADSLALLLAEMQDENVSPQLIRELDVSDKSGHWARSQKFLDIVSRFFAEPGTEPPDPEARLRHVIAALTTKWAKEPPGHPVLVAGSTGSRGSTASFMRAVVGLPQGALILPGFDFCLPDKIWDHLQSSDDCEDHPQFRLSRITDICGSTPNAVRNWAANTLPPVNARNQLVSLALRPAPVTGQWLKEGPALEDIEAATNSMALVQAPSERSEAMAIALALREAAETGTTAALVTPDRMLTRRVQAALDQWRIEPDASIGDTLDLTTPGRLFRHVAELFGQRLTSEMLLILLKHPLVNVDGPDRGMHLRWTRDLELRFRRKGPPFPIADDITNWAAREPENSQKTDWANWVVSTIFGHHGVGARNLSDHLSHHIALTEQISAGPDAPEAVEIWTGKAGEEAQRVLDELEREAEHGGELDPSDYQNLFHAVLKRGEARDPVLPHPHIMIWGTLEARVQGAELVILGGLNDGVWPEHAAADPWLNREMRKAVGLTVPERRIGLSAHDFQQAVAAKRVILTRSIRNAETPTVPSRWLNRLTYLLEGNSDQSRNCAEQMAANGQVWLDMVRALESPDMVEPAPRPAPAPPVNVRPQKLSVTAISRLIRDPYAIYARHVLGLSALDPLRHSPDAPLRGTVLHDVMEQFIRGYDSTLTPDQQKVCLMACVDQHFEQKVPWLVSRALWRARFARIADSILADEAQRRAQGAPQIIEELVGQRFGDTGFELTAKPDRIDQTPDGHLRIYDYKTGSVPSADQLKYFDKQLMLEAVLAEAGAFSKVGPASVQAVGHIGLGAKPVYSPVDLQQGEVARARDDLLTLIEAYQDPKQGYASRRAMAKVNFPGDYDDLARFGEWDESTVPVTQKVGQ